MTVDNRSYTKVKSLLKKVKGRKYWKVELWDGKGSIIRNGNLRLSNRSKPPRLKKAEKIIKNTFVLADLIQLDNEFNLTVMKQVQRKLGRNKINYKKQKSISLSNFEEKEIVLLLKHFYPSREFNMKKINENKYLPRYRTIKNKFGGIKQIKKDLERGVI